MDPDAVAAALPPPDVAVPRLGGAAAAVSEIYKGNAVGLVRLAHIMLGNPALAEDVVQDAFYGLYRHWDRLADQDKALQYVRSSVLNGCRSALRRRGRSPVAWPQADRSQSYRSRADWARVDRSQADWSQADWSQADTVASAESAVLTGEQRREVIGALRQLPARQREALVLRYYLGLSPAEIADVMGIGASTVRSTTHRGLAAMGRILGEGS